jgi:hypothetical protein
MTADEQHPLSPPASDEADLFVEQVKRGGALAAMMGHGVEDEFSSRRYDRGLFETWTGYDAWRAPADFRQGDPAPPLFIFSCYCGNFSWHHRSLAEELLLQPAGPVAVVAATDRSHPLTNYYSSVCLLDALGNGGKRLGALWLRVQNAAFHERNVLFERLAISLDQDLAVPDDLDEIRRQHVLMYVLLGDPAMPVRLPAKLDVRVERREDGWHWRAAKPAGATALHVGRRPPTVALVRSAEVLTRQQRLDRFGAANDRFAFKPIDQLDGDQAWQGVVEGEGTLRLVAVTQDTLYVAAVKLDADTDDTGKETE